MMASAFFNRIGYNLLVSFYITDRGFIGPWLIRNGGLQLSFFNTLRSFFKFKLLAKLCIEMAKNWWTITWNFFFYLCHDIVVIQCNAAMEQTDYQHV